jgi:hypothetical protein
MGKMKNYNGNPLKGFGIFLIVIGLMLLAATSDVFGWGSLNNYIRWEMLLIIIGLSMVLNGKFTSGIIFLAVGSWFILPDINPELPYYVKIGFWPSVLVLAGITYMIPSSRTWCRNRNNN